MTNLKNILSLLVMIICAYLFITHGSDGKNYKKEKQELESKIKILENKSDSLNKVSTNLEVLYSSLQKKSLQDSITSDSLRNKYLILNGVAIQSEKNAQFYLEKLSKKEKEIKLFESNKNFKKGEELINSLSKKINE